MAEPSYRRRVMIDIDDDLKTRSEAVIPRGLRGPFYEALFEDMVRLIEEEGPIIVALIIQRKLRPGDVSPTIQEWLDKHGKSR